ncbi:3D (Asp-Asp-Asp) domain-containing protein [Clostridium acidisoli DSM 12555]|uniref:3D (Asp-Asp-Asp) domain-containing protein n=1 Tax=Clostridium acidisoli DSM 12555 TaxID=1121291 RepID=A0A1W1XCC4_9CLOT|nr:3D domain-containing protein [Clostridium acidisoli]SMC21338.1 3D (Asp-Asp-Asp) domain-containing protein [Clostridium acidisoli DSM 12555]
MKIKALTIITIISLVFTLNSNVFAATSNNDSNELKQTQDNKKQLESTVQNLDNQITDVLKKVDTNKHDMDKLNDQMKDTQTKLVATKNKLSLQQNLLNKRVKAMYIDGNYSYLEVLLGSHNLTDFITKMDIAAKILQYDNNILSNVKSEKEIITLQGKNLDKQNNNLQELKANNELMLSKLSDNIKQEKDLLSKATEKEKQLIEEQKQKEIAAEKAKELAAQKQASLSAASSNISIPNFTGPNSAGTVLTLDATAYSDNSYTSTGPMTTRNPNGYSTIAVDPRVIPLGTKVYVDGYGYAIAADTGGDIVGNRIDVFFPSNADALNWGMRTVHVTILK